MLIGSVALASLTAFGAEKAVAGTDVEKCSYCQERDLTPAQLQRKKQKRAELNERLRQGNATLKRLRKEEAELNRRLGEGQSPNSVK